MSELLKETHRRSGRFVFDTTSGRRRLLSQSVNRTGKPPLIGLVPLRGVTNEVQKPCYCRNVISDFVA